MRALVKASNYLFFPCPTVAASVGRVSGLVIFEKKFLPKVVRNSYVRLSQKAVLVLSDQWAVILRTGDLEFERAWFPSYVAIHDDKSNPVGQGWIVPWICDKLVPILSNFLKYSYTFGIKIYRCSGLTLFYTTCGSNIIQYDM